MISADGIKAKQELQIFIISAFKQCKKGMYFSFNFDW